MHVHASSLHARMHVLNVFQMDLFVCLVVTKEDLKGERQKPDGKCKSESESEKVYSVQVAGCFRNDCECTVQSFLNLNLNLTVISVASCLLFIVHYSLSLSLVHLPSGFWHSPFNKVEKK